MTAVSLQDTVVTLAALGASTLLLRRIASLFGKKHSGTCGACGSGRQCHASPQGQGVAPGTPIPIELLRAPRRQ